MKRTRISKKFYKKINIHDKRVPQKIDAFMVLGPLSTRNLPNISFYDESISFDLENKQEQTEKTIKDIFENMGWFWANVYSQKGFFRIFSFVKKRAVKNIKTHLKNVIAQRKIYLFEELLLFLSNLEKQKNIPENNDELINLLKKHSQFEVYKRNELAIIIHSEKESSSKNIFTKISEITNYSEKGLIEAIEKINNPHDLWKKTRKKERKRLLQKGTHDIKIFSSYMSKHDMGNLTKSLTSNKFNYSHLSRSEKTTLEKAITTYSYYKNIETETLNTLSNRDKRLFNAFKIYCKKIKTFSSVFSSQELVNLSNLFSSTVPIQELSDKDTKDFEKAGRIFLSLKRLPENLYILPNGDALLMNQIDCYFKMHPIVSFSKEFSKEQLQNDLNLLEDPTFTLDAVDSITQERLSKEMELFLQIKKDARSYALLPNIEKKLFKAFNSLKTPIVFEQKIMRQLNRNISHLDFPNPMSKTAVTRKISDYMNEMREITYNVMEYTDRNREGIIISSMRPETPEDIDSLLENVRAVKNHSNFEALIKYFMFPHICEKLSDQLKQTIKSISNNNFYIANVNIETTIDDISNDMVSIKYQIEGEMIRGNDKYAKITLTCAYCISSTAEIEETIAPIDFQYFVNPLQIESLSI